MPERHVILLHKAPPLFHILIIPAESPDEIRTGLRFHVDVLEKIWYDVRSKTEGVQQHE